MYVQIGIRPLKIGSREGPMRNEGGREDAKDRNMLGTVVIDVRLSFNFAVIFY